MGHIRMMGAVQPFLSGAISKTVNMPTSRDARGDRARPTSRPGSSGSRPSPSTATAASAASRSTPARRRTARRRRRAGASAWRVGACPTSAAPITHKFSIGGHEGYMTVGMYEDGTPGELFITMAKEGSVVSGLMDSFATSISMALQYGVPLRVLVRQVQPHALRAVGLHRQPGHPDREVDHRLHLPLAGAEVPPAARTAQACRPPLSLARPPPGPARPRRRWS